MIVVLALLLQAPSAGGVIDQGTFVIRADTQEVGRETFRVLERRVGDSTSGWLFDANARWTGTGRPALYAPVIEIGRDSMTLGLSFNVSGGPAPLRISGQPNRNRFTLRYVSPGVERARELPADRALVVIDDSVFTPYLLIAWRARATLESLTVVFPRSAMRARVAMQDLGAEATTLNRDQATLRHVLVSGGPAGPVHLWLGNGGRLMKVELPDRKLTAERLPS
ncbi:MAG TPA: hypothetical protein VNG35_16955 [Gemmatimonadales bacterium]|nr:hypothetical protein [Gemmatimonadales bacterium]